MEILAAIVELIVELGGEVLLQVLAQTLAQVGIHLWGNDDREGGAARRLSPNHLLLGYTAMGFLAGGVSLLFWPFALSQHAWVHYANLVLVPPISGLLMVAVGHWRRRRGQEVIGMNRFLYGFFFALATAIVRFCWAQ